MIIISSACQAWGFECWPTVAKKMYICSGPLLQFFHYGDVFILTKNITSSWNWEVMWGDLTKNGVVSNIFCPISENEHEIQIFRNLSKLIVVNTQIPQSPNQNHLFTTDTRLSNEGHRKRQHLKSYSKLSQKKIEKKNLLYCYRQEILFWDRNERAF